jgi:hypothetical protein
MPQTANRCCCQGNARAAECSGMTPSVDGTPLRLQVLWEDPEVKRHKETANLGVFRFLSSPFLNLNLLSLPSFSLEEALFYCVREAQTFTCSASESYYQLAYRRPCSLLTIESFERR